MEGELARNEQKDGKGHSRAEGLEIDEITNGGREIRHGSGQRSKKGRDLRRVHRGDV